MLYIDDSQKQVQKALATHGKKMGCFVRRRLYGPTQKCKDKHCAICNSQIQQANIEPYLNSVLVQLDIDQIITGKPADLLDISDYFLFLYMEHRDFLHPDFVEDLAKIFDYSWFSKNDIYGAYQLCETLGLQTCVYCNRLYISTVTITKTDRVIRPTLDHWFSQETHPLLAISFYNLIPSCTPCNSSIKHVKQLELDKHIHPYVDKDIADKYSFKSIYDSTIGKFSITLNTTDSKVSETFKIMRVCDVYQHHQSELKDLDDLKTKYNPSYLRSLRAMLGKSQFTNKDVYRIFFGTEYDTENFLNRPLSKLKRDILSSKVVLP